MFKATIKGVSVDNAKIQDYSINDEYPIFTIDFNIDAQMSTSGTDAVIMKVLPWEHNYLPIVFAFVDIADKQYTLPAYIDNVGQFDYYYRVVNGSLGVYIIYTNDYNINDTFNFRILVTSNKLINELKD